MTKLDSPLHASPFPEKFHERTSDAVIRQYSRAAMTAISKNNTIDGVSKSLWHNPNDWYWIPKLDTISDIKKWMHIVGLIPLDDERVLWLTLWRCMEMARTYMQSKGYYLPTSIQKETLRTINEITQFMRSASKLTKSQDIRSYVILLKVIRAFYKNILILDVQWDMMFDTLTGEMRNKDKKFIDSIIEFFSNSDFFDYDTDRSTRFSKKSGIAKWRTKKNGTDVDFIANFDTKTLDSQVQKTISQNSYDAAESMKDRNRMRIEVKSPVDMLKMWLVLATSGLFGKWLSWEQKWQFFTSDSADWIKFQDSYLNTIEDDAIKKLLSSLPTEKIKWNTPDRQELKLVSNHPSFEVQIVLTGSTNEKWWNASPFYKMKADIDEEITLRQGYIDKKRIFYHINRRLSDLEKYGLSSDLDEKKIFDQFLSIENKVIPLYPESTSLKKDSNWENIAPNPKHADFFTNRDFTGRAVQIRRNKIPYKVWHDSTQSLNYMNENQPTIGISSPSNS